MGITHMVSAGHYLSAAAGYRILEDGGNAIDAGVASGIANTNFGGVAPIMIYLAETESIVTISGLGRWPKRASIDYFVRQCNGEIPGDIRRAVVPGAPDAWLTALERFGTMTLEQVLTPSVELARDGYPLSAVVQAEMAADAANNAFAPENHDIFMPGGTLPAVGQRLVQADLATTFERLIAVERGNAHRGREAAIRAARDFFYKGEIAEQMVAFSHEQGGLMEAEDLAEFSVRIEPSVSGRYREYTIHSCGPWCQGPVVPQTLQLLENDDLGALGHNSANYVHLLSQALNLCFADRDRFYGDPDFVDVPMERLMSHDYAQSRRTLIDMQRAFPEMPPSGDPHQVSGPSGGGADTIESAGRPESDTSYTCVVDAWGNAFSATPSDSNTRAPIVPGLGISMSGRGTQSWLDPGHASCLAPGKRPRLTPNPAIALRDGKLWMPFGCPGGDAQCQAMVQTFLNIVVFGMDPQEAIEQPRFTSWNFPDSFWPHTYQPGRLELEGRFDAAIARELARRGHDIGNAADWEVMNMGVMSAIVVDAAAGTLSAGADPRRDAYAIGR